MNASDGVSNKAHALDDFILLNEEIADLVRARLPIEPHLARLANELPTKSADLAQRIGRWMEQGDSFAAALEKECGQLPPAYRATILAGVESGQLDSALQSLTDSASRMSELRRVTGIAALYPLVIVLEICFLLALIASQYTSGLHEWNAMPSSALARLAESTWTMPVLTLVVPGLVILLTGIWWFRSGRVGGLKSDRFGSLTALPWVRRIHYWGQAASLADLLRLLVERGLPLDQALSLSADAVDIKSIRRAAHEMAAQLRQGQAIPPSSFNSFERNRRSLPPLIYLAISRADDRESLTNSLRQAADMYHDRAVRKAELYAQYLPVLLTLLIGGTLTIGFTLLIFSPYASMLHDLARWQSR